MRVAVVSPYHREPVSVLRRCVDSVAAQTHPCTHILVADGAADPRVAGWPVQHISLPCSHADCGDTPRLIGSASAYAQGFDALCWLDADNWFEPEHVESLLDLAIQARVLVATATRMLHRSDGGVLGVCTESDGVHFTDTNCYLLLREAMPAAHAWGFKDLGHGPIGDRYMWRYVRQRVTDRVHNPRPTVNYTTRFAHHYLELGAPLPPDAKIIVGDDDGSFRVILFRPQPQTA